MVAGRKSGEEKWRAESGGQESRGTRGCAGGLRVLAMAGDNGRNYNRPMRLGGTSRRWLVALLAAGVLLFFALLGALQAFNFSRVSFLNPDTSGATLAFTGLIVVVFLLFIVVLTMLFRNNFKL